MAVVRESSGVAALDRALAEIVERVAELADADLVVARLVDEPGTGLIARAVHAPSASLRAELEGSRIGPDAVLSEERDEPTELPRPLVLAAEQLAPAAVLQLPVRDGSAVVGSLELMRRRRAFDGRQRVLARAAAAEIALARRAYGDGDGTQVSAPDLLALAGDALAAGSDESRAADQVAALAAEATGAVACLVWRYAADEPLLAALSGSGATAVPPVALDAVRQAQATGSPVTLERLVEELPGGGVSLATLQLGQPPLGALQLVFAGEDPGEELLARLGIFAVRAAHALRASERRRTLAVELERTRALLTIVGQAIAQLSLTHTLETAVERLAEVRDALEEVGLEAAVAVPLRVADELVGLLAVYPERGRELTESEESLLRSLAVQLAVAVQNARLHEETKRLGAERTQALEAELEASKRLRALYEISRSFTESLSLQATLDAVARTIVESLGVDAAALRMPDERGTILVPVAVHVREERLSEPLRAVIPLTTQAEIQGTLTLLSLDSDRPIAGNTLEAAISIAGQAALALDNARLYQQQKRFADTMQRSLLPRTRPRLEELEIGDVYDSSARMDVGGDVYDFLELTDGCLAVVLGDVTGHGIDAAADMAMAKFVFRSLAREHPQPGDFLAS